MEFKDFSAAGSEIRQWENSAGIFIRTSGNTSGIIEDLPEILKKSSKLPEVPEILPCNLYNVTPLRGSSVNVSPYP